MKILPENPIIRKLKNTLYVAIKGNGLAVTVLEDELRGVGAVQVTKLVSGEIWRSAVADLPGRSVQSGGKITLLLEELEKVRSSHARQMGRGR